MFCEDLKARVAMAVYYVITAILVRKLGKITPAEVLKNRE